MNTSPSFLSSIAPVAFACCLFSAAVPLAVAQQPAGLSLIANPVAPGTAATPPATTDVAANVENPPSAAKPDPNASTETEILATDGADFASKERVAVFKGDVRVNDPRFQLACDMLTVFLTKTASTDGTGKDVAPAPGNTPPPAANGGATPAARGANDQNGQGGIDHAIAAGHVIIIQKRPPAKPGEEPKISIGRAAEADFDNKTGDMLLRGTPSVEQNGNTHVALSPSTTMTLHKDNSMTTVGPSRTVIKQQHNEESGGGPAPSPGAPGGSPAGKKRPRSNGAPPS